MNSSYLKACAMAWLRYTHRCPIVVSERGLFHYERPDVLAVTKDRQLVEVEVKISLADFKNDGKKWKWNLIEKASPRRFYYLVPEELKESVLPLLKPEFGLLVPSETVFDGLHVLSVVKRAKSVKARKLRTRELVKLIWHQSGTLVSAYRDLAFGVKYADLVLDEKGMRIE